MNPEIQLTKNVRHIPQSEEYLKEIPLLGAAPDYEMSRVQLGHWLMFQYTKKRQPFNSWIIDNIPHVDFTLFYQAIRIIVDRHELLRTTYDYIDGRPRQIVHPYEYFPEVITFEQYDKPSKEVYHQHIGKEPFFHQFDPVKGPLFYAKLAQTQEDFIFIFCMDHSISDNWTTTILKQELFEVYQALAQGEAPSSPSQRIQYKDFVSWHNNLCRDVIPAQFSRYWYRFSNRELPETDLSRFFSAPAHTDSYREELSRNILQQLHPMPPEHEEWVYGNLAKLEPREAAGFMFAVDQRTYKALKKITADRGISFFNLMVFSLQLLIYRLTGSTDSVIGVNLAMRNNPDLLSMVGFMLNTVLLRNQIIPGQAAIDNLEICTQDNVEAFDLVFYPFERILHDYDLPFSQVSRVFVNMITTDKNQQSMIRKFEGRHLEGQVWMSYFDLDWHIAEQKNGVEIVCEYVTSIFRPQDIEQIHREYLAVLSWLAQCPEAPVSELQAR